MLDKKKTTSKYRTGDMVWLRYYPEDCQYIEGFEEIENDWIGPFLVLEVLHESDVLKNENLHNKIDIPSILFEPTVPQWYYSILTEAGELGAPIREDYLEIFSKADNTCP